MSGGDSIVLISPDLRTRSFVRAQLIEEGMKVSAFQSVDDARHWMYIGARVPSLIVVDVWRNPLAAEHVEWLADIADRSPVIFLMGARDRAPPEMEAMGQCLRRPISIGAIVSNIRSKV